MKVTIRTNSQAPIGACIEQLLMQADDVFIATAYLSARAIDRLRDRLAQRQKNTPTVDILFGLDAETDLGAVQAVYDVLREKPDCLKVRYTPHHAGRLFHPKVYYFQCRSICHILIASANLTQAGHYANEEIYCYLETPVTHEVVAQFNSVRSVWFTHPFSAELTEDIVGAMEAIEYAKEQRKQAEEHFGQIIDGIGKGFFPPPVPPKDVLAPLRTALGSGYLITSSSSLSSLSVSIQDILKPTEEPKQVKEAPVVVVQNRFFASVTLLPDEVTAKFSALQRLAKDVCETYSLSISAGLYVPKSAQAALSKAIQDLERQHQKLITANIKHKTVINQHLKNRLEQECRQAWQQLNPAEKTTFPEELLQEVQKRIKERRTRLEANPSAEVRFSFQAYPHPLILMNAMPEHPAWSLHKTDPDQELIRTIFTLLRGQVNLILGITLWTKPSIIKREYEQVRLLIAFRGKSVDVLLRSLAAWVREAQPKTYRQSQQHKKQMLAKKANAIKVKAKDHLHWLTGVESLVPSQMVEQLTQDYTSFNN